MTIDKNKVALLVHSCDRYEFLYKGFEFFFSRHWNFDIPCNYYFATEEKRVTIDGFQNIQSGKGQWTDRLSILLKKIPENYILYFQEDMWLNKDVNTNFFTQLFELTIRENWQQVKLHSSEVYKTIPTSFFIEGFNIAQLDNAASDYLMSHQVTLWNKNFLMEQIKKSEHPWRNERRGTKRLKKLNVGIFHADYFAENGKPEINTNNHPIGRSEYQTISVNGTLNDNVLPFITVLENGNSNEKQYAEKLCFHYEHQLTHDGLPKPRKEDFFKKLKKWVFNRGKM
ncbi:hypothetical protein [Segetibacter koreensis]|uniref:hypothetical protein n=1 Tax=Segetibacter koreensis TaxID=398037 RepID=UPI000382507F|nr:hypothetical protein [Segetibacter koreensis]